MNDNFSCIRNLVDFLLHLFSMKSSQQKNTFSFGPASVGYPLLLVLIIWIVFWFEIRFGFDFNYLGVQPRSLIGLRGIVFSPFIHGSMEHLYKNTIPLLVLSMGLFSFYRPIGWKVLLYGTLMTGFFTWCIGQPFSVHIGASGVIYCLTGFLFFKGIWSKNYRLIALSLIVVFIYGSLVWGTLPGREGISWEGHLSGLVSGIVLALIFKNYTLPIPKYEWEKETYKEEDDLFMQHFDEDGNFVESPKTEEDEVSEPPKMKITYHYRKKE
ncbi:MAG TPA: rhomboid family intramembrane serine protease [Flavobacteriaceae bacterium]|nr:rhomboid family intramembrane serine protease [Flavobacteriaceae bacterium]